MTEREYQQYLVVLGVDYIDTLTYAPIRIGRADIPAVTDFSSCGARGASWWYLVLIAVLGALAIICRTYRRNSVGPPPQSSPLPLSANSTRRP